MLDEETKKLAHHERRMGNKAVPIFQQAVNKDPELYIEAQAQITAAVHTSREVIVLFYCRLGNILYFASGHGKEKADTEGGMRKQVRKDW